MNRYFLIAIIVIAISLGFCSPANAAGAKSRQANAREFFKEDPAGIFDVIPKSHRIEMLEYFDNNMMKDVTNAFDGKSQLTAATPEYLCVNLSPGVTVELLAPQSAKSSLVIANYTYKIPATDGSIKLYSADGKSLRNGTEPARIEDFIIKNAKSNELSKSDIIALADFPVIYYTLNAELGTVTAHLNIKEQVDKETYSKIAPYLRDTITYKVNPGKATLSRVK